jgi:hypothetical protein
MGGNTELDTLKKVSKTVNSTMICSKNIVSNIAEYLGLRRPEPGDYLYEAIPVKLHTSDSEGVCFQFDAELYAQAKRPKSYLQKIGLKD